MTEKEAFEYLNITIRQMRLMAKLNNAPLDSSMQYVNTAIEILLDKCKRLEEENGSLKLQRIFGSKE